MRIEIICMFLVLVNISYAQAVEKTVSGTVTDQDSLPLPGVNIVINATITGTQTRDVTISEVSPGVFSVSGDNAFTSEFAFLITDICSNLTVVGGDIPSNFGIPNSGYGTVDAETGNLTIFYTVDGFFTDREMILIRK